MMEAFAPLIIGTTILVGLLAYKLWGNDQRSAPLPPSPKSYPLIGHLLSLPQSVEHIAFMKMCQELRSDIISLSVLGTTIIVLNKREDATRLIDKRSATYADRVIPIAVTDPDLLDWSTLGSSIRYGERCKIYRRLMNQWIGKSGTSTFHDAQKQEARSLLRRLLKRCSEPMSSTDLESELILGLGSTLFRSIYGYEVKSLDDPYLVGMQSLFTYTVEAFLPSTYLVNTFSFLKYVPSWLPGAGWKRRIHQWREKKDFLVRDTYRIAMEHIKTGSDKRTIVESLREEALRLGLGPEQIDDYVEQIAITLYGGGTETTVNSLQMFFLAMVLSPEAQRKAQQELDLVVGDARLPSFEDQPHLEYVGRVVQETLRWQPVTPLALPHGCLQDDIYNGYLIPEGSIVIGNVWAMTRDPSVYPDPEMFEPDRFLDPSVPTSPHFGWGRRRCPGASFAEAALFIFAASILSIFEISAPKDEDGNDILPSLKMAHTVILHPEPFEFKLTPRSTKQKALVLDLVLEAEDNTD